MPETTRKTATAKTAIATPMQNGASEQHANLAAALAAFQAEMPTVHKGQTARIPGKDGRQGYSYQYADLADVAKVAHPILARHGLSFHTAPTHLEGVGFVLQGILRHTSGEDVTGCLPITGRSAQDLGSSLTYLRRYLLGCMTGIVTDDDEDGEVATSMGTQRPEVEAPPAYQGTPEPQPHQVALRARLDTLAPDLVTQVQAWWGQQGLRRLDLMDPYEASAVMSHLDEMQQVGAFAPRGDAPDPT